MTRPRGYGGIRVGKTTGISGESGFGRMEVWYLFHCVLSLSTLSPLAHNIHLPPIPLYLHSVFVWFLMAFSSGVRGDVGSSSTSRSLLASLSLSRPVPHTPIPPRSGWLLDYVKLLFIYNCPIHLQPPYPTLLPLPH